MIKNTLAFLSGLLTVFKHLFKRPVTLEYPEKNKALNDTFRGRPIVKGCVGCGVCKKVCPASAINYIKDSDGKVISYTFDLKKCIFCGNCAFYCPQKAIKMTNDYEIASKDINDLKLNYKGESND